MSESEAESSPPVIKNVVMGILFKRTEQGLLIMTQKRVIQTPGYNPLGNNTQEVVGETIQRVDNRFENPIEALLRGIREETGQLDDSKVVEIYGASSEVWTTDREDFMHNSIPFAYVCSQGIDPLWHGPVYLVEVTEDFKPDPTQSDGEATEHRWWKPEELAHAMRKNPKEFFNLHAWALSRFAHNPSYVRKIFIVD